MNLPGGDARAWWPLQVVGPCGPTRHLCHLVLTDVGYQQRILSLAYKPLATFFTGPGNMAKPRRAGHYVQVRLHAWEFPQIKKGAN